jgi:acyl-CoA thioester hydrolase
MPAASFEQAVRVVASDLDEQDHVNNVVYVRWVQDAATAHWVALSSEAERAEVAWVLLRHEIDYRAPARLGDEVLVRTAVGHLEGLTFERLTELRRAADGRVLASSRTLWCPVDPRTGRPRRVSESLRGRFSAPSAD